jgi:drug/metabolite transporter (DMT)-like permease
VAGLAGGDTVGGPALAGLALALPAVGLVAAERGSATAGARLGAGPLLAALLAGAAFGAFFVLLHQASPGSGLWPVVVARAASAVLVGAVLAGLRVRRGGAAVRMSGATFALVAATGLADMSANVLYLLAVRRGPLSVVGLLASLYPVSTVILATALLRERLSRAQLAGVGGCAVAVALIAWG